MDRVLTLLQTQVVLAGITFGGMALALIGAFYVAFYSTQRLIGPLESASQRLHTLVVVVRNILEAAFLFGLALAAVVSIGFRQGVAGAVIGGALGAGVGVGIELTADLAGGWIGLQQGRRRFARLLASMLGVLLWGPCLLLEISFEVVDLVVAFAVAIALGVPVRLVTILVRWVLIVPAQWVVRWLLKRPRQEPAAAAHAAKKRWWPDSSLALMSGTTILGPWLQGAHALRDRNAPPNWRDHVLRRVPRVWQVIFSQALWLRGLIFLFVIGHLAGLAIRWVIEHAPAESGPTTAVVASVVGLTLGYAFMWSSFLAALVGTIFYASTRSNAVAMEALSGYDVLARFPASLLPRNRTGVYLLMELFQAAVCGLLVAVVSGVTFGPVVGLVNGRTVGILERIVAFICTVFATRALALARLRRETAESARRAGVVGVVLLFGGIAIEGVQYFMTPR